MNETDAPSMSTIAPQSQPRRVRSAVSPFTPEPLPCRSKTGASSGIATRRPVQRASCSTVSAAYRRIHGQAAGKQIAFEGGSFARQLVRPSSVLQHEADCPARHEIRRHAIRSPRDPSPQLPSTFRAPLPGSSGGVHTCDPQQRAARTAGVDDTASRFIGWQRGGTVAAQLRLSCSP